MSSGPNFDVTPRKERFVGIVHFDNAWSLKLVMVTAAGVPFADEGEAQSAIGAILRDLTTRMSTEFDYGRFGFALVHTGRRGTCVTITHFGNWGPTFEVFSSSWYAYGRGFGALALLDDMEPACCWFEFPRTFYEIRLACQLARENDLKGTREKYLAVLS